MSDWYETGSRSQHGRPLKISQNVLSAIHPPDSRANVLWRTLPCGCEEEVDRASGTTMLHYIPTCWRHADQPPYVIEEQP